MMAYRAKRGLVSLVAAILLAGCGGTAAAPPSGSPARSAAASAPSTAAGIVAYQGADRQQMLEDGARKEGHLLWYTSLAGPVIDRLFAGFKQKYPYIETQVFRGDEGQLLTRETQEAQSGKDMADVFESTPTTPRLLADANLLARFTFSGIGSYPQNYATKLADGTVESAVDRVQYVAYAYNTSVLSAAAEPKTLQDLLKPELAGKLGLAGSSSGPRWVGGVLQELGPDKGKQFLTQMAAQQKPKVYQVSATSLNDLIAKGEVAASPTVFESDALRVAKESQAPVKWLPLAPVVVNAGEVAIAAKAPHPHAAALFVDYLLNDGRQTFADIGMHTPLEKTPADFKVFLPEQGKSASQISADTKAWGDLFSSLFR